MTRLFVTLLACACWSLPLMARAQGGKPDLPRLEVTVDRVQQDGQHLYAVGAVGVVQAPVASVWKTLTAYERMAEFVPDMTACRVMSRNGNEVIIEQFGNARFLFVSRAIHLIVRATEQPMSSIDIALISGDMKHYESRWELAPMADGATRLTYSGKLMPNFYVPGMLGTNIIHRDVERMMGAVLARIEKQDAKSAAR